MPETSPKTGLNRRQFLKAAAVSATMITAGIPGLSFASQHPVGLPEPVLPWSPAALEPIISARTMTFHFEKHHMGYWKKANKAIKGTSLEKLSVPEILNKLAKKPEKQILFNNVAQYWNHDFYWNSMKPKGGGSPDGRLMELVRDSFGGIQGLKEELLGMAGAQFGSGWGWLVYDEGKLWVTTTSNAATPITDGVTPLLTVDVWEHAYYLDYQNRRMTYLDRWFEGLVNWDFASKNLEAAL